MPQKTTRKYVPDPSAKRGPLARSKDHRVSLYLSPEIRRRVQARALADGTSMSHAVRSLIVDGERYRRLMERAVHDIIP